MKPYMNIELYQLEHEDKNESKRKNTVVENALFQYQSKVGRASGKAQSPRWFREALAKHLAEVEARTPKKAYLSDDPNVLG